MAKLKTIICFGQSNMEGLAPWTEVADQDFARYFGENKPGSFVNYSKVAYGINIWTPQLPMTGTNIVANGAHTTTIVTFSVGGPATLNRWVVCTSGTAANVGEVRFISAISGSGPWTFTVDTAWPATPVNGDTFNITTGGTQGADHDYLTAANPGFTYVGKFMPMQLNYQTTATYTYTTGYDYSNIHGVPPKHPAVSVNPATSSYLLAGPMVEIMWQMRHEFPDDLWVIQMPIPYSFLSVRGPISGLTLIDFSWFRAARTNDWNPSSSEFHGTLASSVTPNACFYDLYGLMIDYILKGQAKAWVDANRPGDQLDVQGIFVALGESESDDYNNGAVRANAAGRNMRILRDTMRKAIYDAGLTTLSPQRIPFILQGMDEVGYPGGTVVNPQYAELEKDDIYTGFFETTGFATRAPVDPKHFTGQAYVTIGQLHAAKWREIKGRETSASTPDAKRRTLESLIVDVKRRYERNNATNDSTDETIIAALNDAHRDLYLELGDQAWFLRRLETFALTGSFSYSTSTLPRRVHRVMRIESELIPGKSLPFTQTGRDAQGQMQIMVPSITGGNYRIHYMHVPDDLLGTSDLSPVPDAYRELVVVLTCARLAENGGNTAALAIYQAKADVLWKFVKRDCMRVMRQTQNAITAAADAFGAFADYETGAGGY